MIHGPKVCADLKAQVLIDDSSENAIECSTALPVATRVLLFGDYEWNKRISGPGDGELVLFRHPINLTAITGAEEMSFDRRLALAGGREFWKKEKLEIPDGAPVDRVKDWSEVIRWITAARHEGRIL